MQAEDLVEEQQAPEISHRRIDSATKPCFKRCLDIAREARILQGSYEVPIQTASMVVLRLGTRWVHRHEKGDVEGGEEQKCPQTCRSCGGKPSLSFMPSSFCFEPDAQRPSLASRGEHEKRVWIAAPPISSGPLRGSVEADKDVLTGVPAATASLTQAPSKTPARRTRRIRIGSLRGSTRRTSL